MRASESLTGRRDELGYCPLHNLGGKRMDRGKSGFGEEREAVEFGEQLSQGLLHPLAQFAVALEKLNQGKQARRLHSLALTCARPADELDEGDAALAQAVSLAKRLDCVPQIFRWLRGRFDPGWSHGCKLRC